MKNIEDVRRVGRYDAIVANWLIHERHDALTIRTEDLLCGMVCDLAADRKRLHDELTDKVARRPPDPIPIDSVILPALRAAYEEIEYAPPNLIDTGDMYAEGIVEGHGDALEILKKHLGPWLGEEKETP